MPRRIRKVSADCPKCGQRQDEPADFISTLCRGCGETFHRAGANHAPDSSRGISRRLAEKFSLAPLLKRPPKSVYCYHCGHTHEVSAHARTTLCSRCNAHIQLEDVLIDTHASRAIDTRGNLHIGPKGYLNTTASYCTRGTIQGRISGLLICETTLTLSGRGRCQARIEAQTVIVDRDADLMCYFPIRATEIIVRGKILAVACSSGQVIIKKNGRLDGSIRARSFQMEQGGSFNGQLAINTHERMGTESSVRQEEFPFLVVGDRPPQLNSEYAQI